MTILTRLFDISLVLGRFCWSGALSALNAKQKFTLGHVYLRTNPAIERSMYYTCSHAPGIERFI